MLGVLDSPCLLFLLIYPPAFYFSWFTPITNTTRWNLGLAPRSHFLERELIHWMDKTKNLWKKVGQLPIKTEWWDPLPCTPAFRHKFHVLAFHRHPTFKTSLVGSAFRIKLEVCGGAYLRKQSVCLGRCLFSRSLALSLMFGNSVLVDFHHWGYTRESWTPPAS